MGKGLREIYAHNKMQRQRQYWKSEKPNQKAEKWHWTEPRRPCDSAGIIFDPLSFVCIAGEAARVLPQGAQLSQQLSIWRPEKLPGNVLPTWDWEVGTRNRLLARAEGNDGSRHPISRSGLCDSAHRGWDHKAETAQYIVLWFGLVHHPVVHPSISSCGSS